MVLSLPLLALWPPDTTKRQPHRQEIPPSATSTHKAPVCVVLVTRQYKHARVFRARDGPRASCAHHS